MKTKTEKKIKDWHDPATLTHKELLELVAEVRKQAIIETIKAFELRLEYNPETSEWVIGDSEYCTFIADLKRKKGIE